MEKLLEKGRVTSPQRTAFTNCIGLISPGWRFTETWGLCANSCSEKLLYANGRLGIYALDGRRIIS